ncbi:MAG: methyltransferase [Candidatus Nanopelagicales bacterium]|nr:methyltransferase [Candidatus Nanopelagicales bacterium]
MQMMFAAIPSRILATLAQLSIPDAIGDGAKTASDVASAIGAHEPWVLRLMRAGASLGVLRVRDDGSFENTPLGNALRSDTEVSVRALGVLINEPFHFMAWGDLPAGVRAGEVPFERVHGQTFFEYLNAHPEANAKFGAWMTQTSAVTTAAILGSYDFSQARTIIDVGGGQGALLASVLRAEPHARGILYDTPDVVLDTTPLDVAGVRDRCESVGGDFLKSVPAGGDLLMLKTVLHDWDDDVCVAILRRCRESVGDNLGARLLILEAVLPDDCSPHPGFMMDINMMVLNHGGRERTSFEYGALLAEADFQMQRTIPTPSLISIVEATAV